MDQPTNWPSIEALGRGQLDMGTILGHRDTAKLTIAFLSDRVGMTGSAIAKLLALTPNDVVALSDGHPIEISPEAERSIRGLAVIQSMLLTGYTPESAAAWMRQPCRSLSGMSPREVLNSGETHAIGTVLNAAVDRMST